MLKTKHNSYASFHVSVVENYFHLINNTGVWPNGCLIAPYYGPLNPDQIYTAETSATSQPPTPGAGCSSPPTPPNQDPIGNTLNHGWPTFSAAGPNFRNNISRRAAHLFFILIKANKQACYSFDHIVASQQVRSWSNACPV
jgi:hypothetical protein